MIIPKIRNIYRLNQLDWYFPTKLQLRRTLTSASITVNSEISLSNEKFQKYLESLRKEFYDLRLNNANSAINYDRISKLSAVVNIIEQRKVLMENINSLSDISYEKDEDMKKLIKEENDVYTNLLQETENTLVQQMLKFCDSDSYPSVLFEVNAGAGGQEAMLFANELYQMYVNFIENNSWHYDIIEEDTTDIGGLRHANLIIRSEEAYNYLRYEAGVHRVQRVPSTDKSGRIHTSTVSVTVIPQSEHIDCTIDEKDLKIETKRASGAGGQHVNTTDSAVRIVHIPTGIAVESQSDRSQNKNREIALQRLQGKILQQQLRQSEDLKQATRKAQQGNLNRNEKIRTYNFVQDRITDHRMQGGTVHNLTGFLEGGTDLSSFINRLIEEKRRIKLLELITNFKECDENSNKRNKN